MHKQRINLDKTYGRTQEGPEQHHMVRPHKRATPTYSSSSITLQFPDLQHHSRQHHTRKKVPSDNHDTCPLPCDGAIFVWKPVCSKVTTRRTTAHKPQLAAHPPVERKAVTKYTTHQRWNSALSLATYCNSEDLKLIPTISDSSTLEWIQAAAHAEASIVVAFEMPVLLKVCDQPCC